MWQILPDVAGDGVLHPVPGYCGWLPFADFLRDCQPYSAAELAAESDAQLAKIRAINPVLASAASGAAAADRTRYCAAHPAECGEYTAAVEHPTWAAILGPAQVRVVTEVANTGREIATQTWWMLGLGLGVIGLIAMGRRR